MKFSLLDSSYQAASNGSNFIFLGLIDSKILWFKNLIFIYNNLLFIYS